MDTPCCPSQFNLPNDIWGELFTYMGFKEYQVCKSVCHLWFKKTSLHMKQVCENAQKNWKEKSVIPDTLSLMIERLEMINFCAKKLGAKFFADSAISDEYMKFLQILKYFPNDRKTLGPPPAVYTLWHTHILHTKCYAKFCDIFVGNFLHHVPDLHSYCVNYAFTCYNKLFPFAHNDRKRIWENASFSCISCCFEGQAKIKMADNSKKIARDIKIGDYVLSANNSPQKIIQLIRNTKPIVKHMVKLGDFWITRGHPIFVNENWYRPDELFPTEKCIVTSLVNFVLDGEHTVIVGQRKEFVCCTMGKYCGERLERLFPEQNDLYGKEFLHLF